MVIPELSNLGNSEDVTQEQTEKWYLNVWICVRNLLANKTRSVEGWSQEKRKARERLFGGRELNGNVKET